MTGGFADLVPAPGWMLLWGVEGPLGHYLLWGGLALLLLAPAFLSRTRWSESRPLVICVALSVFAHLLLMIYAYATRLPYAEFLRPGDGSGGETIVALSLLDDSADAQETNDSTTMALVEPAAETPERESPADASPLAAAEPQPGAPPEPRNPASDAPENETLRTLRGVAPPDARRPTPMELAAVPPPPPAPQPDAAANETPDAFRLPAEPATAIPAAMLAAAVAAAKIADRDAAVPQKLAANEQWVSSAPDASMDDAGASARRVDGRAVPLPYRNRQMARRLEVALQHGGNVDTEGAVRDALAWLSAQQSADGRWSAAAFGAGRESRVLGQDRGGAGAHADMGLTGLALLAFLGAGETHLAGPHREKVQHGLEFLLRSQRPDGELAGSAELFARMYCHGMATLALSESYAMTGDDRIRPYLERAVSFTIRAQDPTTGGWRYRPGDSGDTSQFGWQLMSLKSAQLAGIEIPPQTWQGARRFLHSVSSGTNQGLASYRPGERPTRTMTAEALLCRILLGDHREPQVREALGFVLQELPRSQSENHYYWYYGTLALFQSQGDGWPVWNDALQRQLLARQQQIGSAKGSWDPDAVWGAHGGRVFSTAMAALCLEVYYRYLPLYQTAQAVENSVSR